MTIILINEREYVHIESKSTFLDAPNLSWGAKGLLSYLLYKKKYLIEDTNINSLLQEIRDAGYIRQKPQGDYIEYDVALAQISQTSTIEPEKLKGKESAIHCCLPDYVLEQQLEKIECTMKQLAQEDRQNKRTQIYYANIEHGAYSTKQDKFDIRVTQMEQYIIEEITKKRASIDTMIRNLELSDLANDSHHREKLKKIISKERTQLQALEKISNTFDKTHC